MVATKTADRASTKELLRTAILKRAYVRGTDEPITLSESAAIRRDTWMFDFHRLLTDPTFLSGVATLFWEDHKSAYPFQVGGIEAAAVPILTSIGQHLVREAKKEDATTFFIRKSRKREGLMRMVEGIVMPGRPIILVDDILDTGKTCVRQLEVLRELGFAVRELWVLVQMRDDESYDFLRQRGIIIRHVFTLADFPELDIAPPLPHTLPRNNNYRAVWKWQDNKPNMSHILPKSNPCLDDRHVYMGTDGGAMVAIDQRTGKESWRYTIGVHTKGKAIFSSPVLTEDTVIFGGYDGNVYALNKENGKRRWVYSDADWIGSSPTIASDLGMVFVGLEFCLFNRRGGIAALDLKTGRRMWWYEMPAYTHASPTYLATPREVAIGSNDGVLYIFDAKTGSLRGQFTSGAPTVEELASGFTPYDIKEGVAYDGKRDYLIFGNKAGMVFVLDRKTAKERARFETGNAIFSTPLVYEGCAYVSSLDKHLYCYDLKSLSEKWRLHLGARVFSSPTVIQGSIVVGANTGRMTEINPRDGTEIAYVTVPERITNTPVYNPQSGHVFLPTAANELYCLERIHE